MKQSNIYESEEETGKENLNPEWAYYPEAVWYKM